ncbi:c-type cytochrome [Pseudaestuariivita sp.]|uniref:c-type cytochrome n=1 Tax=Pseudaestuariivita sp. TaxID=2211669 RepID=UPI004058CC3F
MPRKFLVPTVAALSVAVTTAAFSGGHGSPEEQVIGARNALMTLYGFNSGILGGMARGNVPYDAESAIAAAENLAAAASMDQMHFWVPGTDNVAMEGKTRALPAIWETPDDYAAKNQDLADAAAALVATAGDGVEAVGAGMGQVGAACSACHKAYRGPRI